MITQPNHPLAGWALTPMPVDRSSLSPDQSLTLSAVGQEITHSPPTTSKAFEASWKSLGVRPIRQEDKVVGALFGPAMPMTLRAVSNLDGQPVRYVNIVDDAPEPGSLRKLASMPTLERIHLGGGKITKAHLEELYEAQHLKGISLRTATGLKGSDINELRQRLPQCEVEVR